MRHGSRVGARSSRVALLEFVIDKTLRSRHGELGAVRRPALCSRAAGSRDRRSRSRGVAADRGASSRRAPRSRCGRDCGLPPVRAAPERPRRAPGAIVLRDEWAVRFGSGPVSQVFARAFALVPAVLARPSCGPRFSMRGTGGPSNKRLQLTAAIGGVRGGSAGGRPVRSCRAAARRSW